MLRSELEYQHANYDQAHKRLMGGLRRTPQMPRQARDKMKALIEAQIKSIDIIPRGRRSLWLKAIEEADPAMLAFYAKRDQEWRAEVAAIVRRYGENMARVRGENRDSNIVACRRTICEALYRRGWSLTRIGHLINRDHTSALHLLHPERYLRRKEKLRGLHGGALAKDVQKVE